MLFRLQILASFLLACCLIPGAALATGAPVLIGLDAEFGYKDSTSAEAIRQGILLAIEEINARGGVLGGRPRITSYNVCYTKLLRSG